MMENTRGDYYGMGPTVCDCDRKTKKAVPKFRGIAFELGASAAKQGFEEFKEVLEEMGHDVDII